MKLPNGSEFICFFSTNRLLCFFSFSLLTYYRIYLNFFLSCRLFRSSLPRRTCYATIFSPLSALLADPPNRCGGLCGTNRPEAEGWLRPFSLITSHLCVHKRTNTSINLRARHRARKTERQRQTEGEFCVIYCRPWSRSCHLPCSVTDTSLEGHRLYGLVTSFDFSK